MKTSKEKVCGRLRPSPHTPLRTDLLQVCFPPFFRVGRSTRPRSCTTGSLSGHCHTLGHARLPLARRNIFLSRERFPSGRLTPPFFFIVSLVFRRSISVHFRACADTWLYTTAVNKPFYFLCASKTLVFVSFLRADLVGRSRTSGTFKDASAFLLRGTS